MRNSAKTWIVAAAGILLAFAPPAKVNFKFELNEGVTYIQTSDMRSNVKQTIMGQEMLIENATTMSTNYKVKKREAEATLYEMWYDDIELSFSGMGQTQKFSSADTSEPVGSILAQIINRKFDVAITPKAEVKSIDGLEELLSSVSDKSNPELTEMVAQVTSSFNEEGMRQSFESSLAIFPDKVVKTGDSWKKVHFTGGGMPLRINNTYTFDRVEGDVAIIQVNGTVDVDPENATGEMQGMEATFFFEGNRTGTIRVEVETGWVTMAEFRDKIGGSITLAANAMVPDGMTVPVELDNTTRVTGQMIK